MSSSPRPRLRGARAEGAVGGAVPVHVVRQFLQQATLS